MRSERVLDAFREEEVELRSDVDKDSGRLRGDVKLHGRDGECHEVNGPWSWLAHAANILTTFGSVLGALLESYDLDDGANGL
jgi:hypothetical protein